MDDEDVVRSRDAVMLRLGFSLLCLLIGCGGLRDEEAPMPPTSPEGEIMMAVSPQDAVMLEFIAPSEIIVRWSNDHKVCSAEGALEPWLVVRQLAMDTEPEIQGELSLDPNRGHLSSNIALARPMGRGRYEVFYVEGSGKLVEAGSAVQSILDACDVDILFEVVVHVPHKKTKTRK